LFLQPADTLGVNYRALDDLFAMAAVRAHDTEYTFTVQMLEIYNEQVQLATGSFFATLVIRWVPLVSNLPLVCTQRVCNTFDTPLGTT
jgi:hypothetical protein